MQGVGGGNSLALVVIDSMVVNVGEVAIVGQNNSDADQIMMEDVAQNSVVAETMIRCLDLILVNVLAVVVRTVDEVLQSVIVSSIGVAVVEQLPVAELEKDFDCVV